LKEKTPKVETLATCLAEVEFVLNSRQLAFASMDLDDPARITPNHLLFDHLTFKEIIAHCSALLRMK
jgi:hypothetical protein